MNLMYNPIFTFSYLHIQELLNFLVYRYFF